MTVKGYDLVGDIHGAQRTLTQGLTIARQSRRNLAPIEARCNCVEGYTTVRLQTSDRWCKIDRAADWPSPFW
jgi:hypothetical protein